MKMNILDSFSWNKQLQNWNKWGTGKQAAQNCDSQEKENRCNELHIDPSFVPWGPFLTVVQVSWTQAEIRDLPWLRQRPQFRAAEMAGISVAETGNKGASCMGSTQKFVCGFFSSLWTKAGLVLGKTT